MKGPACRASGHSRHCCRSVPTGTSSLCLLFLLCQGLYYPRTRGQTYTECNWLRVDLGLFQGHPDIKPLCLGVECLALTTTTPRKISFLVQGPLDWTVTIVAVESGALKQLCGSEQQHAGESSRQHRRARQL